MAKLGEVCLLKAGKFVSANDISPEYNKGLYPCFGGNGIRGYVADYTHDGEFPLIGRQGALCGNVNLVSGKFHATEHAVVVQPKIEMNVHWLYYALNAMNLGQYATGAAQPGLAVSKLETLSIEIPNISEQNKIAQTLYKVEQLVNFRKQQLAKLDELVKARFVEMFGDPVKNTMDWEIKPLSELGELNRGVSKARPRNSPELLGGPYPLIQTGEVANAKTYITSFNSTYSEKGLAQSKMWPKGTLCITIAANIAQTSILTFDACFPDSVVGFISRNMTNELFIHYWFSFFQKILDEQAPQVAQKNINLKILSELNVIVPPLSLQNRFAAFVERVDQQKQTVQQSLEKLELMKKALMQEYFG